MDYFDDLRFFRFGHMVDHRSDVSSVFHTYALNFLANGSILFQIDQQKAVSIHAPALYWTWPGPHFRYARTGKQRWEHYFVSFTGDRPKRWIESELFIQDAREAPVWKGTEGQRIRSEFERLFALLRQHPIDNPEAVLIVEALFLNIHRQPTARTVTHPRHEDIMRLTRQIEDAPDMAYDFNRIASTLHMSVSHLRRLFALFTGSSPVSFLNKTRMHKAAQLLRGTRATVKEVALEVGYEDVFYFTRLFTREHGLSPALYRRAYFALGPEVSPSRR